jgi:nuclear protein 1
MADTTKKTEDENAAKTGTEKDEYEHYNYDMDKHVHSGHSGKGRTKKEAEQHTNHPDPGGHTRKTVQKLMNNHEKEKELNKPKNN